jgi:hypothetical protein
MHDRPGEKSSGALVRWETDRTELGPTSACAELRASLR